MANYNAAKESLAKANAAKALKTQERIERFVSYVREQNGGYITASEIAEKMGVSTKTIWNLVHNHIRDEVPEVVTGGVKGYRWAEAEKKEEPVVVEPEVKETPKSNYRNAEGYKDPTAAAVLEKLERNGKDRAGEIWSTSNDEVYFLMLACSRGLAVGFTVSRMDEWYDPEYDMTITLSNKSYYINLRRLYSKPAKTLYANYGNIGKARLEYVRTAVTKYLGLPTEKITIEKPVEVIREKIVEKPVEVIKEVPVEKVVFKTKFDRKKLRRPIGNRQSLKQIEAAEDALNIQQHMLEMAEQRADIWEQAFRLMSAGRTA